ncbi:gas vesicle protein [Sphaerisporangium sp. NPDC051017]|uniref:gas vesicle protein n=1 Tax=Sphaerisporangium sp. NPDC051017 TaxID=3154636 RepID=UPI0034178ED6
MAAETGRETTGRTPGTTAGRTGATARDVREPEATTAPWEPSGMPARDAAPRGAALAAEGRLPRERVALVDLLDRLLAGGVVVTGDLVLSIADIELVRISLRALIMSVRASEPLETGVCYEPRRY